MNDPAFNPLVRQHGQATRTAQPTHPIGVSELRQCADVVPGWWLASTTNATHGATIAVLAYLTDPASLRPWVLGLSAAAHRVPLVVAGHGMRWSGAGVKLPAARRAVQALQPHLPAEAAIIFADGSDTAIANPPSGAAVAALMATTRSRSAAVLVAGECNSWPVCYRSMYARHAAHRRCVASGSPACYPNSGLYAGSASSLLDFLAALSSRAADARMQPPERGDDQAALHRLYLSGGGVSSDGVSSSGGSSNGGDGAKSIARVGIAVDEARAVFGGLHACKGSGAPRTLRIKGIAFSLCHNGAHEPLRDLTRNGSAVALGPEGSPLRPLLLHASGNHDRLARAFLGDAQQQQQQQQRHFSAPGGFRGGETARERQWARVFARTEALMRHPVLLFDSAEGAARGHTCSVATLGDLVHGGTLRVA